MAQNWDLRTSSDTSSAIDGPGELYSSIDVSASTFRLLHVTDGRIFRLETHSIAKAPTYFVLSYAWKEATDRSECKYIFIQGRTRSVSV